MQSLADILAAEADAVSAFCALLREEQECLKIGKAEALPELIARKNGVLGSLAPLSDRRNALLAGAGLPADRAGMERWLTDRPQDERTQHAWKSLQLHAAEAKELNRVNGELIRMHLASNARALEALQSGNAGQDLYGANGQSAAMTGSRIIDSA